MPEVFAEIYAAAASVQDRYAHYTMKFFGVLCIAKILGINPAGSCLNFVRDSQRLSATEL